MKLQPVFPPAPFGLGGNQGSVVRVQEDQVEGWLARVGHFGKLLLNAWGDYYLVVRGEMEVKIGPFTADI